MSEDKIAVETTQSAAPENPVKTEPSAGEVDYEAVVSNLLDENKKLSTERENYRRGLLKAKGKLQEEEEEPKEDLEALVDRKVRETLVESQWGQSQKKLEEMTRAMAKENKELKLALVNKASLKTTSQGSGSGNVEVQDRFFSQDQINSLKAKGYDDKKIELLKQNLQKAQGK